MLLVLEKELLLLLLLEEMSLLGSQA